MIDDILKDLQKKHGQGSVFSMNQDNFLDIARISTGSIDLDVAIGGGIPEGRITVIAGKESSGKTTLMCHVLAESQKKHPDKVVGIIDVEHSIDKEYTAAIGVDLDKTLISQPDSAEQAWRLAEDMVKTGKFSSILVDSIAALVPQAEIEGEIGDANIALGARLNGQALRKINPLLKQTNTTLLFTNQLRANIGTFGFGEKTVEPGGNGFKFFASLKLAIARKATNKDKGEAVSNRSIVKVKKNKTAPPFKEAEFDIVYGIGIDKASELIDYGVKLDLVDRRGSNYYFIDFETCEISETRHSSKKNAVVFLNEDLEYCNALERTIKERLCL